MFKRALCSALLIAVHASAAELSPSDYSRIDGVEIRTLRLEAEVGGKLRAVVAIRNSTPASTMAAFECSSFASDGQPEDSGVGIASAIPPGQEVVAKSTMMSGKSEKVACRISNVSED